MILIRPRRVPLSSENKRAIYEARGQVRIRHEELLVAVIKDNHDVSHRMLAARLLSAQSDLGIVLARLSDIVQVRTGVTRNERQRDWSGWVVVKP